MEVECLFRMHTHKEMGGVPRRKLMGIDAIGQSTSNNC